MDLYAQTRIQTYHPTHKHAYKLTIQRTKIKSHLELYSCSQKLTCTPKHTFTDTYSLIDPYKHTFTCIQTYSFTDTSKLSYTRIYSHT